MTVSILATRIRPAAILLTSLFAAVTSLASAPAEAQLFGDYSGAVKVGCPYRYYTSADKNTGFLDENATYGIAQIPLSLPNGASIRIEGRFPQVRYFSLQSYEGAKAGNYIDAMADARISNTLGLPTNTNVATLPTGGAPGDAYVLQLRYEAPPADRALRAANVLYVGTPTTNAGPNRVAKQIIYRIYLPNPGTTSLGNEELPKMIYRAADGSEIDFRNTPDAAKCDRIESLSSLTTTLNPAIFPSRDIRFQPVAKTADSILYPNGDSTYLRAAGSKSYGDVIVVRAKRMVTPLLPPLVATAPIDVRYLSLCQYELSTSAVVSCFTDDKVVTQQDDYVNYVLSVAEKRPLFATEAYGYNWKAWGGTFNELLVLRQILARPGFAGDYINAVNNPEAPVSLTLGEYAPEISYCDATTFLTAAPSGGAALMAACKAATSK